MGSTKTTLYLSDDLRARLKALALRRGTTLSELLAEGAALVLERSDAQVDHEELVRRASAARQRMRDGFYEGESVADRADDLVYGARRS